MKPARHEAPWRLVILIVAVINFYILLSCVCGQRLRGSESSTSSTLHTVFVCVRIDVE